MSQSMHRGYRCPWVARPITRKRINLIHVSDRTTERPSEQANYWPREPSVERSLERRIYMSQSMHRGSSWRIFLELEFLRDGR